MTRPQFWCDQLYRATTTPQLVEVPPLRYLSLDGHGDPNTSPSYADAVQALYSVSHAAKFAVKKAGGATFKVSPLEGLWWADDMSTKIYLGDPRRSAPEKLRTIIRQPYAA